MHQSNWSDWAHLVSPDLVRWTRLKSALAPKGNWDGTLSMLDEKPVILYDCANVAACLPSSETHRNVPNDRSIVGVARPANYDDVNLTEWIKDPHNPISILNGSPGAGPSNIWRAGGVDNMLMTQGRRGPVARYVSTDPLLHNWTVAQHLFFAKPSDGICIFQPLPTSITTTHVQKTNVTTPTHMLGHVPVQSHEAGTPWFVLGSYDESVGVFEQIGSPVPLDSSELVCFQS